MIPRHKVVAEIVVSELREGRGPHFALGTL